MRSATVLRIRKVLEYLQGVTDEPPCGFPLSLTSPLWGIWWAILLTVFFLFAGQSSKFIYIDF